MNKSKNIFAVIFFLILLGLVLIFFVGKNNNAPSENKAAVEYGNLNKIVFDVKTAKVLRGDLVKRISADGIVKANKEIDVVSKIGGIIEKIYIDEGKYVKKGDLLLKLNDDEYRIELKEAQNKLTAAEVELAFVKKFSSNKNNVDVKKAKLINEKLNALDKEFSAGRISKKEYELEKSDLEIQLFLTGAKREEVLKNNSGYNNAINSIARAKLNIKNTELRAPFNGVVGDFNLSVGELIPSWKKLFKLFQTDSLKIDVGILEDEIDKVRLGSSALVKIGALGNNVFKGKVISISPFINTETKTGKVTILLFNKNKRIKPGMFANVNIQVAKLKNRILIPKQALLVRNNRTLVFTVEDSLAKWKYVKTGEENDKFIEIISGVKPGEDVVVSGQFNLAHDSKVRVINKK